MTSVIVDTGPLVALINSRERHHVWASEVLDTVEPPIFTCDPVLSEACFLLQNLDRGSPSGCSGDLTPVNVPVGEDDEAAILGLCVLADLLLSGNATALR